MHPTSASSARRRVRLACGLLAAALAVALAGGGAAGAASATSRHHRATVEHGIANSLLSLLNRERAENKLPPLTMDSHLVSSAHSHNLAMARTNIMSHQERGEADLGTRLTRAGYTWSWAGENIGWNSQMTKAGVLSLERMMYHEKPPNDGHRLNILSTHFKNIGVDVYMDSAHHKVWLTTDFGRH